MDTSLSARRYERHADEFVALWIIATVTYGVGDVITTIALFYFHPNVGEANPVLRWAMTSFDLAGLVGLKIMVFVAFIVISVEIARRDMDPLLYYAPPAVMAVLGAYLTVSNIVYMIGR